jgi:hypothetical protein
MSRSRLRILVAPAAVIALVALAAASPVVAQKPRTAASPSANDAVSGVAIYQYVKTMAAAEFSGRLTGDAGYTAFARWAADRFKAWGLKPLDVTDGYLMPFPTQFTVIDKAAMAVASRSSAAPGEQSAPEVWTEVKTGPDYLPLFFSDSGDLAGPVAFVGWCISAPELGYDDYAGVDVKGKWAMCFRGTPNPADRRFQVHDEHRTRMKTARAKGALGVLYIYDEPISNPNGDFIAGFLPAVVSAGTADLILKEKGISSAALRADLLKYRKPLSFELGTRVRQTVTARHVPEGTGYNVVGVVEGSDPSPRKEYIVVGGHADHTGRLGNLLFPGANDNASGTAVAMEIGRALAALPVKPKRTIVIVLFGGEEMGLKGSQYFVDHLPPQLGTCAGMINFDMVGAGDGLRAAYTPDPAPMKAALDAAVSKAGVPTVSNPIRAMGVQGSDHGPFMAAGFPVISFSSNGPHLAYHQVGDTIFRVNPDMLEAAARVGYPAAFLLELRGSKAPRQGLEAAMGMTLMGEAGPGGGEAALEGTHLGVDPHARVKVAERAPVGLPDVPPEHPVGRHQIALQV